MRHKLIRLSAAFLRYVARTVARIVITTFVFSTCLVFTLRYLGIPVPSPYELLRGFEGLSKLAKILS
jgi:hypothetical protein